ncbi:MAG: hypothetical protein ABW166_15775 [Sedimenticola sp.]
MYRSVHRLLSVILTFTVMMLSSTAGYAEKVTWMTSHFPPISILKGDDKGTGYADLTMTYFLNRMAGFEHQVFPETNFPRALETIKREDGVCHPALLKSKERELFIEYSKPVYYNLPNHLIIHKDKVSLLEPHLVDGIVNFLSLAGDGALIGTVVAGRVYGPSVTEALRKIGKVDHISEVMQTNSSYKQLNAGWADYTVSYPAEVPFQLNTIEMKKNDLRYFPIHGMEGIVLGYFGCSKRKLGKKVIEAVNDLIDQSGSEPPWRAYYRRWLNESGKELFDRELKKFISSRRQ